MQRHHSRINWSLDWEKKAIHWIVQPSSIGLAYRVGQHNFRQGQNLTPTGTKPFNYIAFFGTLLKTDLFQRHLDRWPTLFLFCFSSYLFSPSFLIESRPSLWRDAEPTGVFCKCTSEWTLILASLIQLLEPETSHSNEQSHMQVCMHACMYVRKVYYDGCVGTWHNSKWVFESVSHHLVPRYTRQQSIIKSTTHLKHIVYSLMRFLWLEISPLVGWDHGDGSDGQAATNQIAIQWT